MEADRKAMPVDSNIVSAPHFQERITYKVGSKVIFQHILSPRIVKGWILKWEDSIFLIHSGAAFAANNELNRKQDQLLRDSRIVV